MSNSLLDAIWARPVSRLKSECYSAKMVKVSKHLLLFLPKPMPRRKTASHRAGSSDSAQRRMVDLLRALAPNEGYNLTALPGVRILRSDRPLSRTPVLYDPGIVIV